MAKKKKSSLTISKTLDLHGYTIQGAYEKTREFLEYCQEEDYKNVRIITGKSGQIFKEFPTWIENFGCTIIVSEIGSFVVKI